VAVLFRFEADDEIIVAYLPANTRANVTHWQTSDEYNFEFHSGHLTGNPIYIRPDGNRDGSNVPKFDTLNKNASDYSTIGSFANSGKLDGLSNRAKNDILAIISNNWAALQALANNYWVMGPVDGRDAEEIEMAAWANREMEMDTGQHSNEISMSQLEAIYPRLFFARTRRIN
jgi:hypothetical protein